MSCNGRIALTSYSVACVFSALLLSVAPAKAGSISDLDAQNGFRNITCDAPVPQGLTLEKDDGDEKDYARADETLKLGSAVVSHILYTFYKGQFSDAFITTKGMDNGQAALAVLIEAYGPGHRLLSSGSAEAISRFWKGHQMGLLFKQDSASGDASIAFICLKVRERKMADEKGAAAKGKNAP